MTERANALIEKVIGKVSVKSRQINREICSQFEGVVAKLSEQPDSTQDLVELLDYNHSLRQGIVEDLQVSVACVSVPITRVCQYPSLVITNV